MAQTILNDRALPKLRAGQRWQCRDQAVHAVITTGEGLAASVWWIDATEGAERYASAVAEGLGRSLKKAKDGSCYLFENTPCGNDLVNLVHDPVI